MSLQTSTDDSKRCRCRDCTGSRCPCCLASAAERDFALPADVIGDDMASDRMSRQEWERIKVEDFDRLEADLAQAQARAAALAIENAELLAAADQMKYWLGQYRGVIRVNAMRNGNEYEIDSIDAALAEYERLRGGRGQEGGA